MDTSNILKTVAKACLLIKDVEVWEKYKQIWDVIKNKLSIKFHRKPIYEQKHLTAKVRESDGVIKQILGVTICQNKICVMLALLATIDSVMRIDKKSSAGLFRGMQI